MKQAKNNIKNDQINDWIEDSINYSIDDSTIFESLYFYIVISMILILVIWIIFLINISPKDVCYSSFRSEDSYFISTDYNEETGALKCTLHRLNSDEVREYQTVSDGLTGIHVIP